MNRSTIDKRLGRLEVAQPAPVEYAEVTRAVWVRLLADELRDTGGITFDPVRGCFVVIGRYGDRGARRLAVALNKIRAADPSVLFFPALTSEVDYTLGELAGGRLRVQLAPAARMINVLGWNFDQRIVYPVARAVCVALDQCGGPYPRDLGELADLLGALRPFCFDLVMCDETPRA